MSPHAPPLRDVLAVTIGAGGVRARRTGRNDAADSFVELPDAPVQPSGAASVVALVEHVTALTDLGCGVPEAAVWAIPPGWAADAADQLLAAARARAPAARAAVVAQSFATHAGALGGVRPGTCLDVGAGAVALATDLDQIWHRIDGWGHLLGSRGSGAWIGAQGLAAGLRWRDGVPDGSATLLAAGRAAFGDEASWPGLLATADAEVALTSFAPAVSDAAHEDPIARAIMAHAGEALAEALLAGRALLGRAPIVVVGGLLYLQGVRVALASSLGKRQAFLQPGLGGALEGARLIGEHLLAGGQLPHRPPYVVLDGPGALGG